MTEKEWRYIPTPSEFLLLPDSEIKYQVFAEESNGKARVDLLRGMVMPGYSHRANNSRKDKLKYEQEGKVVGRDIQQRCNDACNSSHANHMNADFPFVVIMMK